MRSPASSAGSNTSIDVLIVHRIAIAYDITLLDL